MNILITRQLPLDTPGGESTHLFALASHFERMGAHVHLMPVTAVATPAGLWPVEQITEVPPFGLHPVLDSLPLSRAAARLARAQNIDAVLGWQHETALLPEFAGRRRFVYAVIAAAAFETLKQNAGSNPVRRAVNHCFRFRPLRMADVVFCASQAARASLVKGIGIPAHKIRVLPIGVDEIFQPLPRTPDEPLRRFIFAGSSEPLKGVYDALSALAIVRARGWQDWEFRIFTWGQTEKVEEYIARHGLGHHVRVFGRLSPQDLAQEMGRSQLAILPSHTESFGLSIAEAQACGLPVVSYRAAAIPEVVLAGETGLLAEPFDHVQLAEAIIALIENPRRAYEMGQKGHERMRALYSWEKTAGEMLRVLRQTRPMT